MKKLVSLFVVVFSLIFILNSNLYSEDKLPDNVKITKGDNGEYIVNITPDKDGKIKRSTNLSNLTEGLKGKDIKEGSTNETSLNGNKNKDNGYPVYKNMDEKSDILTRVKSGKSMVFLERKKDWVRVATEDGIGYMKVEDLIALLGVHSIGKDDKKNTDEVSLNNNNNNNNGSDEVTIGNAGNNGENGNNNGDELTGDDNNGQDDTTSDDEGENPKGIPATITYDKPVHVRLNKSLESEEQVIVNPGTEVNLVSIEDDWCKIEFEGKVGYVRSFYLGIK